MSLDNTILRTPIASLLFDTSDIRPSDATTIQD